MNFSGSSVHHGFAKFDIANGHKPSHKVAAVAAEASSSSWKRESVSDGSSTSSTSSSSSPPSAGEFASFGVQISHKDASSPASLSPSPPPSSSSSMQRDPWLLSLRAHAMESLIYGMFASISSLKKAFLQLHSAHAPYDSPKLRLAEGSIIAELKKFSELKQTYRARMAAIGSGSVHHRSGGGGVGEDGKDKEAKAYDRIISSFQEEICSKDGVIQNLREALDYMEMKKEKLEKKVQKMEKKLANRSAQTWSFSREASSSSSSVAVSSLLSPCAELLEWAVIAASEASKDFAKLLVSHMKSARWDIDAAANSIEPGVVYMRSTHKKFAFESYVTRRMLSGFESKDMGIGGGERGDGEEEEEEAKGNCFKEFLELRSAIDPEQAITLNSQGAFARYCLTRFLDVVHPKMEESFFGHHPQQQLRREVSSGMHPFHSQFYQSFLRLAKAMWMLHKLAVSFRPHRARIFEVRKGEDYSALYMESIVRQQPWMTMAMEQEQQGKSAAAVRPKVCFTVMPGFRVHNTIIKCQVYVAMP